MIPRPYRIYFPMHTSFPTVPRESAAYFLIHHVVSLFHPNLVRCPPVGSAVVKQDYIELRLLPEATGHSVEMLTLPWLQ